MRTRDLEDVSMLAIIGASESPVGSRRVTHVLRESGTFVSESTVSRLLRQLDAQSLTRSVDGKGRILTTEGRRRLANRQAVERRDEAFARVVDIDNVQDLLDLLLARRALEREAARAVAIRATADEIAQLEESLRQHEESIAAGGLPNGVDFHRLIGKASGNKLLIAMTDLVFDPLLDRTEEILDIIIGSHHSEMRSVTEHKAIVEALAAHDPDAAEAVMVEHVNRLIQEVEQFAASHWATMFNRMLAWVKAETTQVPSGQQTI